MHNILLKPGEMTLADLQQIFLQNMPLTLPDNAREKVEGSCAALKRCLATGARIYGVNTGFGSLASEIISDADLQQLQRNLVLSHCAGVGEPLSDNVVRLVMVLKMNALLQGYSAVRWQIIELILALYHAEYYPLIPSKGSVGASGDLAPLAAMAAVLIGEGEVRHEGVILPAATALDQLGLKPLQLEAKEGLALLNGTQVSTALALQGVFLAERCFDMAVYAGALSVEAAQGSHRPFSEAIHVVRKQSGQIRVAAMFRELFIGSEIVQAHKNCSKVQDPYCLRCQPQVMGACLDQIEAAADVLELEANAVTDNPLVVLDAHGEAEVISGGNFHAEPVAFAADNLALAIAEIGALAERRIALLIDQRFSDLPAYLVEQGGLHSGFMMPQVTAAALASENKSLAHPASVDSMPTSANQEDHVSMATFAARRLAAMADNTLHIIAIELLMAVQGVECHLPIKTSAALQQVVTRVRSVVSRYEEDRMHSEDIATVVEMLYEAM